MTTSLVPPLTATVPSGLAGLALSWAPTAWAPVLLAIPVGLGGAAFVAAQNAIV